MLKIKHQVFISSTFTDLKEERKEILDAIVSLDCIPAGMEFFPAVNDEQFEFIKRIIDDSDYYVLIIGGRYGSISPDGVSYTEKEYDYAIEKSIPVLCFLRENIEELPVKKVDMDYKKSKKLEIFKQKVSKGRLVKFWTHPKELAGQVVLALSYAKNQSPAQGWVKGIDVKRNEELEKENNKLLREIMILKDSLSEMEKLKVQKYYFSSGYHYSEVYEILINKKIEVPEGKLGSNENIIVPILNVLQVYKKSLLEGVWNNKASTPDEIFLYYRVCPELAYLNLLNKYTLSGATTQKFELSDDGKKFLTLLEMNEKSQ